MGIEPTHQLVTGALVLKTRRPFGHPSTSDYIKNSPGMTSMVLTRNPSDGVRDVAPKALDRGIRRGDGEKARLNFRHRSWWYSMPDRVDDGMEESMRFGCPVRIVERSRTGRTA